MDFFIISIDHNWQLQHCLLGRNPLAQQFQDFLNRNIAQRHIDLICEESDPKHVSIAQVIAYEHQPRIPWVNIDMLSQQRLEAGIWLALLNRPMEHLEDPPGFLLQIGLRIPEDEVREQFFCERCRDAAVSNDAKSVLVLCGDMHVESLSEKLKARGHQSATDHSLTPVRHWR